MSSITSVGLNSSLSARYFARSICDFTCLTVAAVTAAIV